MSRDRRGEAPRDGARRGASGATRAAGREPAVATRSSARGGLRWPDLPLPAALSLALLAAAFAHASAVGTWFAQDDVTFLLRARGDLPRSYLA